MTKIGDVVRYRGRLWVVHKIEEDKLRLLRWDGRKLMCFRAGAGDVVAECHPTFTVGQTVKCSDGRPGVVVDHPGDGPVKITQSTRFELPGGGFIRSGDGGSHLADRATLILENSGGLKG
jgi:hypothetical protein